MLTEAHSIDKINKSYYFVGQVTQNYTELVEQKRPRIAASARLLDAEALDGHADHDHGGEDAEHDGVVLQI